MIAKIKCKICNTTTEREIPERQSKNKYYYGQIKIDMRGIKTRKYCIPCGLIRKKSYKDIIRIDRNKQRLHTNTQSSKIENELKLFVKQQDTFITLEYYKDNMEHYRYNICKIYDKVSNKLHVPKATIRRVMSELRKNGTFK